MENAKAQRRKGRKGKGVVRLRFALGFNSMQLKMGLSQISPERETAKALRPFIPL